MREKLYVLLCGLCFIYGAVAQAAEPSQKDWTLLVYLNGDNNLDSFGTTNLEQMETVGSTDHLNIVVQWASLQNGKTQRLLVQKSTNPSSVTSPVLQDMGVVDMGDWHTLESFIEWGAKNFPAKHYFVDVWDHGSGWHAIQIENSAVRPGHRYHPTDISWDDNSGNSITTQQLGQAIAQASQAIGQKIDIYGSDACLMGMVEVAGELRDSVSYFLGSQEVEPGAGWPYDAFLRRWTAQPDLTAAQIATALAEEYGKSYTDGSSGGSSATMAVYDLSQQDQIENAIANLKASILKLDASDLAKVTAAASSTQSFAYRDYGDLHDFVTRIGSASTRGVAPTDIEGVLTAFQNYVVSNDVTPNFNGLANGVSIWLPKNQGEFADYSSNYEAMAFEGRTGWSQALKQMYNGSSGGSVPHILFMP
ncbi:MAG: clostripain-related cysteine peptidase [Oligoflexia bacterium]|nr:clostripain-related cysteine peptidase [Oligoflexia bacterium]